MIIKINSYSYVSCWKPTNNNNIFPNGLRRSYTFFHRRLRSIHWDKGCGQSNIRVMINGGINITEESLHWSRNI
jgi:hypothetical protein